MIDAAPYFGHPEADLALLGYFEPYRTTCSPPTRRSCPSTRASPAPGTWRLPAYLAVVAVAGDDPFGRRYLDRLAAAIRLYR